MEFTGFKEIEEWEGLRLTAYKDSGGVLTIGFGHTGPDVKEGMTITRERANELLIEDLKEASWAVNKGVKVDITQNQFNALVSFAFNVGVGAFLESTALSRLNNKKYEAAAEALTWFNKITNPITKKKEVSPGLVNRRKKERELFLRPDDVLLVKKDEIESLVDKFVEDLRKLLGK